MALLFISQLYKILSSSLSNGKKSYCSSAVLMFVLQGLSELIVPGQQGTD